MASKLLFELKLTDDVSLTVQHFGTGPATDAIGFRVLTSGREVAIDPDTALALIAMTQAKQGEQTPS